MTLSSQVIYYYNNNKKEGKTLWTLAEKTAKSLARSLSFKFIDGIPNIIYKVYTESTSEGIKNGISQLTFNTFQIVEVAFYFIAVDYVSGTIAQRSVSNSMLLLFVASLNKYSKDVSTRDPTFWFKQEMRLQVWQDHKTRTSKSYLNFLFPAIRRLVNDHRAHIRTYMDAEIMKLNEKEVKKLLHKTRLVGVEIIKTRRNGTIDDFKIKIEKDKFGPQPDHN